MTLAPVTVIIPAFNATAFLADALASVRAQRHPVAEVLVVDDRSTDGTPDLARALGARVIVQPENRGPSAARNRGLREAATDVIAFLDADDAWLPWHVALCARALAERGGAAVACSESVGWAAPVAEPPPGTPTWVPEDPVIELIAHSYIAQSAVVARRERLLAAGGYPEGQRHAEDYALWMRLAQRGDEIVRVCTPGLRYREHPGQATRALQKMYAAAFDVRLRALAHLETAGDAARVARARRALTRVLDATFGAAWYAEDPGAFDFLVGLAPRVPGGPRVAARWALRRHLGWRAYHALRRVRRRLRAAR